MLTGAAQVEGQDKNPYGIFGGIARLARVLHFCPNPSAAAPSARFPHPMPPGFLTNASETQACNEPLSVALDGLPNFASWQITGRRVTIRRGTCT